MSHWEASGKSDDWHTPKYIFDALGCKFDMDVAAPTSGPLHVPTMNWIADESLTANWKGFVWMNPPYGGRNSLDPWLKKFIDHGDGIALVPDRTSAPWFQKAVVSMDLVMFTPKIKFIKTDGTFGHSPSNGSALLAIGAEGREALWRALNRKLGVLVTPEKSW